MTTLVVLSVVDIVLLIAGLAFYLFVVGGQLTRVAGDLEECADIVWDIKRNAEPIVEGVANINRVGGVVAGALPLLYGMAEGIVAGSRRYRSRRRSGHRQGPRPGPAGPGSTTASATHPEAESVCAGLVPALVGLAPGRERAGGRRGVLTDPLVAPGLVELLLVAARAVDRRTAPGRSARGATGSPPGTSYDAT